ncbi:MAG: hypothetical protein V1907_03090 [Candidatus Kerfeldbacteria bacterium]
MGSSPNQWERALKLVGSAIELVTSGARTPTELADHLQGFVFGQFIFEVDFDDPEWDRIDRNACAFVGAITASDYPRKYRGKKRVTVRLQKFDHDAYDRELIDLTKRQREALPDRAISETFGRKFPGEQQKSPVIGICGDPVQRGGRLCSPDVSLVSGGVDLDWYGLGSQWDRRCRFLVVCSVVDL